MTVAFLHHPMCHQHETDPPHPESSERLDSILKHIEPYRSQLLFVEPEPAAECLLEQVHSRQQIDRIKNYSESSRYIGGDTETSPYSYPAALVAAGAGPAAIDLFRHGLAHSALAAIRPPGHHATANQSMGFCLFNNAAMSARYAQSHGYQRVLIVDFDVHHGNGTQDIFYEDDSVFYFSSHQLPSYPGSGDKNETGRGDGIGYTGNYPLAPGDGDAELLPIYQRQLPKVVEKFRPDILLVSAGYDIHVLDPLANLKVSTAGVMTMVEALMECSDIPKLFLLEGGYHLQALGECVATTIEVLLKHDAEIASP